MLIPKLYFDDSLSNFFEGDSTKMKCDIYEKENKYYVEMDLPGFKKDEIKIECNKGNLVISAENVKKMMKRIMNVIIFVVKEFIINTLEVSI